MKSLRLIRILDIKQWISKKKASNGVKGVQILEEEQNMIRFSSLISFGIMESDSVLERPMVGLGREP